MKAPFSLRAMAALASCVFTPIALPALAQEPAVPEAPAAAEPATTADADAATPVAEDVADETATEAEPVIEEVFVTAQRKKERLQDVPIAVNVISGDALANMGLSSTEDLQAAVPGLEFISTGPAGTPFLRGVGSNAGNPNDEPSVALYVDGVYIGASFANVMGFNNIERVEVLKGPQGTLFGRNATGGVIQLVTRDPKHAPSVEVSAGVGNYRSSTGGLYATTGLSETIAVDVAVQAETQDKGWGRNLTRNSEDFEGRTFSARSKLLFTPDERLNVRLSVDHAENESAQLAYKLPKGALGIDGQLPPDDYDSTADIQLFGQGQPLVIARQSGAALRADYQLDAVQLVSITSYRDSSGTYWADADGTAVPFVEGKLPLSASNFSQELQLISAPGATFDWVAGAYLYRSKAAYNDVVFSGLAFGDPGNGVIGQLLLDGEQKTDSTAVYAQANYEVLEGTKLTGGLRYTDEKQSFESAVFDTPVPDPADRGFEEWTWRAALDHAFNPDVHSYLSYNRGIKGGGFDLLSPGGPGFEPETLDAYELGLKSQLLNRRLRFNAAYFFYDYQNIQVQVIKPGGTGVVETTNAAKAQIHGLDVDFQYVPFANASLSGGFILLDSEYKKFENSVSYPASPLTDANNDGSPDGATIIDASGNKTIRTPDFSASLTAEYRVQSDVGEFPLSLMISHNDGYFFGSDNRFEQDAYTLVNARVGWNTLDERYGVSLWGRNLTDEYYYAQGVPSNFGDLTTPAAPRTFGVTLRARFGA